MADAILRFFENTFSNPAVGTILIAMLPIIELKGAIPFAVAYYKCPLPVALLYGLVGSSIMIPLYLRLLIPLINRFKKTRLFGGFFNLAERLFVKRANKLTAKADAKAAKANAVEQATSDARVEPTKALEQSRSIQNDARVPEREQNLSPEDDASRGREKATEWYKTVGIFTLVAIPIPLTGVLTGSAAAAFLRLDFKKSLLTVFAGNIIAGIIITLTTGLFI